jgi:hypothetical protein
MKNKWILLVVSAIVFSVAGYAVETESERQAKQTELDAACEAARQEKIILARAKHVEECVNKEQLPDRVTCERFYADYGERAGSQPPLFYDLPECVKAHEYRTSYRE